MSSDVHGKKRALITDSGQDGWYLIELLLSRGYDVAAHSRHHVDPLFTAAVSVGTSATSIGEFCEAAFGGAGLDWTICCHRSVSGVDSHCTRADSSSFGANLGGIQKSLFPSWPP
jgi:hypothetical protein